MEEARSFRGGSRVGSLNASYPFATLTVGAETVHLKSAFTDVTFREEDVISVDALTWLPVVATGVQIHHVREDVAKRVIFWSLSGPKPVLDAIAASGFTPRAPATHVVHRGRPFRLPFLVACALLWNALLLYGWLSREDLNTLPFTWPAVAAPILAFLTVLSILLPTPVRSWALVSEDRLPAVRPGLLFALFVTGVISVGWTAMMLLHA